ncbi:prepilin-type N-terminal cleavage/methylation domain-containing protein [Ephemeroptericola cinctiostellae]|nr:prepilin-type N-terminal cleavage/methylation domain-containing protein [Ephemeroptericola cinctiostellae]
MFTSQSTRKKFKQSGFTLLELLISVLLMLGIVIAVQRYVAGVVVDQTVVQLRQDQSSQVQISLSNLKRDVAQAGSYPFATTAGVALFAPAQMNVLKVGVSIAPCTAANCVGSQLNVASVVPVAQARDCHGNAIQYTAANGLLNNGWVFVYNQYAFQRNGTLLDLTCLGNGAAPAFGWRDILSGVVGAQFNQTNINGVARLIGLCIVTSDASGLNDGSATLTDCAGNGLPAGAVFYKTRIDMPVNNYSFTAN